MSTKTKGKQKEWEVFEHVAKMARAAATEATFTELTAAQALERFAASMDGLAQLGKAMTPR